MKTIYEITAHGFNGGTDETDFCVVWISADSAAQVRELVPASLCAGDMAELPQTCAADVQFILPEQCVELRAMLESCTLSAMRQVQS